MTNTPKAINAQRARRRQHVLNGLTIYGTARVNYQWPELDGLDRVTRMNERIRLSKLRKERGDKTGVGFVLGSEKKTTKSWKIENKILVAEIDNAVREIGICFDGLSEKAKVACIKLGEHLGTIRNVLHGQVGYIEIKYENKNHKQNPRLEIQFLGEFDNR